MRTPDILVNRDLLRRIGRFLFLRPLAWAARSIGRHLDPWGRQPSAVPPDYFGLEEGQSLKQYFEHPSAVPVSNLDDVCAFLLSCRYVPVGEGLGQQDRWMRPHDVEWCRVGDCKALALWAWRRLVELGHDAELVCGEWSPPSGQPGLHAFVVFREGSNEYLLEATARSKSAIVRPLTLARADYTPAYSVDASLKTYMYHGFMRLIPRHFRRAA
jgi:hypothetical protein